MVGRILSGHDLHLVELAVLVVDPGCAVIDVLLGKVERENERVATGTHVRMKRRYQILNFRTVVLGVKHKEGVSCVGFGYVFHYELEETDGVEAAFE